VERGGLLLRSTYHAVLAVKVCARCCRNVLAACGRLRTLTAALRRAGDVSGNPARCTEPTMAHDLSSYIDSSVLLVRDVAGAYRPAQADEVLQAAQKLLWQQLRGSEVLSSPQAVKDYLRVQIGGLEHEVFTVIFLDAQHRLIALKEMFRGTVAQTSVYPREVVKEVLGCNAAAVILAHNHPLC
jgi:DNA repair protein RadC